MVPADAFKLASQLIDLGADVTVEVAHPGITEGNAQGPPDAKLRVISGQKIREDGLPPALVRVILEAQDDADGPALGIASSDLLLG